MKAGVLLRRPVDAVARWAVQIRNDWAAGTKAMHQARSLRAQTRLLKEETRKLRADTGVTARKVAVARAFLDQLGTPTPTTLAAHLTAWQNAVADLAKNVDWIEVTSVAPLVGRLEVLRRAKVLAGLDLETAWRLARAPLDADDETDVRTLAACGRAVANGTRLPRVDETYIDRMGLDETEAWGRIAAAYRWFTLAFPAAGDITHDQACRLEEACARHARTLLHQELRRSVRRCESCGTVCAPWFDECDRCHQRRIAQRRHHYGYHYYYDDDDYYGDGDYDDDDDDDWDDYSYGGDRSRSPRAGANAAIKEAVEQGGPEFARPAGIPRQMWVETALPMLQAVAETGRWRLRAGMLVAERMRTAKLVTEAQWAATASAVAGVLDDQEVTALRTAHLDTIDPAFVETIRARLATPTGVSTEEEVP